MTIIRRLITVFLLAVFAPSTVLAAAPLVICTAKDGKLAIERVHARTAHTHQGVHAVSAAKYDLAKIASGKSDCRDSTLLSGQFQSRRGAESEPSGMDGIAILPAVFLVEPELDVEPERGSRLRPSRQDRIDPRLIELSSVVLLN